MSDDVVDFEKLKKEYTAKIQEADVLVKELEERKKQLTEALDWNHTYSENAKTVQTGFDGFKKTLQEANIKGLLETATGFKEEIERMKNSLAETVNIAAAAKVSAESSSTESTKTLENLKILFQSAEQIKKQIEGQNETVGKLTALVTSASATLEQVKQEEVGWTKLSKENIDSFQKSTTEMLNKMAVEIKTNIEQANEMLGLTTSAALATSFKTKKDELGKLARNWNFIFIACLCGMAYFAFFYHDPHLDNAVEKYGFIVGILLRLPFMAPIFWLAYFAQGRSGLFSRLSDDYGFKESIAIAYQGFKKEVNDKNPVDIDKLSPLQVLMFNSLRTINRSPERIHKVYKGIKTPWQDFLDPKEGQNHPPPQIDLTNLGNLKRWVIAIGTSSALAIIALIWLIIEHLVKGSGPVGP